MVKSLLPTWTVILFKLEEKNGYIKCNNFPLRENVTVCIKCNNKSYYVKDVRGNWTHFLAEGNIVDVNWDDLFLLKENKLFSWKMWLFLCRLKMDWKNMEHFHARENIIVWNRKCKCFFIKRNLMLTYWKPEFSCRWNKK
jgi:hypothetical protein